MNILDLKFERTASDRDNVLCANLERQLIEKAKAFRESVYDEIIRCNPGKKENIHILHVSAWEIGYSQVFLDGVFMGHLHEYFINCQFRFDPA